MINKDILWEVLLEKRWDFSTKEIEAIGALMEILDNQGIARLGRQEINLLEVLGLNLTNA